ncbi:hypothetical protein CMUS01_05618 [Colletotrichum musicola]|uniref:Uncharacterized protein n=1 Tax=Colletotrichum musicola TaxID=2175873 RepID=A0A8H6KS01_9PEZI|nr:hypothetical protein CMUS01_05618 [Colletotrichum musicola]
MVESAFKSIRSTGHPHGLLQAVVQLLQEGPRDAGREVIGMSGRVCSVTWELQLDDGCVDGESPSLATRMRAAATVSRSLLLPAECGAIGLQREAQDLHYPYRVATFLSPEGGELKRQLTNNKDDGDEPQTDQSKVTWFQDEGGNEYGVPKPGSGCFHRQIQIGFRCHARCTQTGAVTRILSKLSKPGRLDKRMEHDATPATGSFVGISCKLWSLLLATAFAIAC